jgi:hypothetical protein
MDQNFIGSFEKLKSMLHLLVALSFQSINKRLIQNTLSEEETI